MKIFIVIPCYNEAKRLTEVVQGAKNFGEVLVVDDGSTDQSFQFSQNLGVTVIRHLVNRGQGAALETGNNYALQQGAEVVVHLDADGQHQPGEIPKLIQPILEGKAEVVLGSRFLNKKNQTPFFKKWLILKPAIILQNLILKEKFSDAHNGFRALSAKALRQITITQDGMAHPTEIIEQLILHRLSYLEVPVTIKYHEFGQGFLAGLKILGEIILGKINR